MKNILIVVFAVALFLATGLDAQGATTYYVDPNGNDLINDGIVSPFKTIQKAVSAAVAGDTVIVNPGNYPEMAQTKNSGQTGLPITIKALHPSVNPNTFPDQMSTAWGFTISHPFITVQGFDITGYGMMYGAGVLTNTITTTIGGSRVTTSGDNFQLIDNTIRDGIWIASDDFIFRSNDLEAGGPSISSTNGDFVASGFRPGLNIQIQTASYAVITRTQVEQTGLNWSDVSAKLIARNWAIKINPDTLIYGASLTEEKSRMWDAFGGDFPKILPVLQQAELMRQQPYTIKNSGATIKKVQSVSAHRLVLAPESTLQDEGPAYAYIATNVIGINVKTNDGLIKGNHVRNLAYEYIVIGGARNLIEDNLIEDQNGWDCFRAWGHDHIFRRNITRLGVHIPGNMEHADYIQTFSNTSVSGGESYNILFDGNWIENDNTQMGIIDTYTFPNDHSDVYHDYIFKNNVFVNVTNNMYIDFAGVQFIGNTFYRAASTQSGIGFGESLVRGIPSDAVVRNNIFLECGHTPEESGQSGFYSTPHVALSTSEIVYYVPIDSTTASGIFSNLVTNKFINSNGILLQNTKNYIAGSGTLTLGPAYELYRAGITNTLKTVSAADDLAKNTFSADFNYAAGAASASFIPKTVFSETNGINGGDPLLIDLQNTSGPDGIPFTDDDGLYLLPNSPLCAKGDAIYPALIDAFRFDAYRIWRELIKDGYLSADGRLSNTFTSLGQDFRDAFPAYNVAQFDQIQGILQRPSAGDIGAFACKPLSGPYAYIQAQKVSGWEPLTVAFNGASSYVPPESSIASYAWNFGDGESAEGAEVTHVFPEGNFSVSLTISDGLGRQSSAQKAVQAAHADYPNLYLYLKLDGDAKDYSGKFADAQWAGTDAYVAGRMGSAAAFDETTTAPYVWVKHNNYLDGGAQLSIAFWAKKNSASAANVMLQKFITYTMSSAANGFSASLSTASSSSAANVSTTAGANDTNWHHYALTYDGSMLQLYLDGATATGASAAKAVSGKVAHHPDRNISVGKSLYGGNSFSGAIDEVRIYDRALTTSEIRALSLGQELSSSISGDVSGDGFITAYDATLALQLGKTTLEAGQIAQKAVGLL